MSRVTLIRVERILIGYDWLISRFFIRGEFKGFGSEVKSNNNNEPTLIPIGEYPLYTGKSSSFSKEFYYSDETNALIGKKDFHKLDDTEKKNWRPHDMIYIKEVPGIDTSVFSWGMDGIGDKSFTVGNVIGFTGDKEVVVQNRYNYITVYPLIYPAIKDKNCSIAFANK